MFQVFLDLGHGKAKLSEIPDHIQSPQIMDMVHAVVIFAAVWFKDAELFVIAEGVRTNAVKLHDFSDAVVVLHKNLLCAIIVP